MSARYVLFDLDGTLLDTEALYSAAASDVCARYGKTYTLALKRSVMGGDSRQGAERVVRELGLPISPAEYLRERDARLEALLPTCQPMPGAVGLVEALLERGVRLAIATSGHAEITEKKLAFQPFLRAIDVRICGDDPRLGRPKPAPDIYLLSAELLGAPSAHCAVVEDSVNGVRAGLAAGMRTFALLDPRWGLDAAQFAGAERILSSLEELDLALLL